MRTRDLFATLRDRVRPLLAHPAGVVESWNGNADPVWRRGEAWVRVEAVTKLQVRLVAGSGGTTTVERVQAADDLDALVRDVAALVDASAAVAP
ncbi:hypothetical protein WPS_02400 [Vulcanimicrobium alpinum]|uniref:Uncharacterized protein n=1 Tax=Vulcanimicrobium alpinum TaxID=3016050 RepID=A0AAN2C816_UNVUL|nr:hypothetical protein [Vulcanimicrobium alpinum]BDE04964.1 hypothetical protein WPS_02400 [Vulcanimicrobium alpinum]